MSPSDPTLTTKNLLEETRDVEVEDWYHLGWYLHASDSELNEIRRHYQNDSQCKVATLSHWVRTHPAPSWKMVATALNVMNYNRLAEEVTDKYIRGEV